MTFVLPYSSQAALYFSPYIFDFYSLGCYFRSDYFIYNILFLPFILIFIGIVFIFGRILNYHSPPPIITKWNNNCLYALNYTMYTLWFPVSFQLFKLICPSDDQVYLPHYPWVSCTRGDLIHHYSTGAFVGLSIIACGPIFVYLFLWKYRNELNNPVVITIAGFFYKCFKYKYWWVEYFFTARKIFFAALLGFPPQINGDDLRVRILIAILLTSIVLVCFFKPYHSRVFNIKYPIVTTIEISAGNVLDISISIRLLLELIDACPGWIGLILDSILILFFFIFFTIELKKRDVSDEEKEELLSKRSSSTLSSFRFFMESRNSTFTSET